jgi:hypothetical protein
LVPKKLSQIEPASIGSVEAKKAEEHDKEQRDNGSEHGYEGRFVALDIENLTASLRGPWR